MEELSKGRDLGTAALRSGMHRNTARKYRESGELPSDRKRPRTWRTRPDPFSEDWPEIVDRLNDAPELEAKALFEHLMEKQPGRYEPGQVRTFQRRVREWRAREGPPKEVFFPQEHIPGEAIQTDFTWATVLGVTISGESFPHMLCHVVLPYSNWEWATVCRSESMAALRRGVQEAVFRIGRVPEYHQTDNSTAATHDLRTGKRGFNEEYLSLMRHLGMKPRTIGIGESHQNGDVEALNGTMKRRLEQHLLLRGNRDFEDVAEYERWMQAALERANKMRHRRTQADIDAMRVLQVDRLPEHSEEKLRVTAWSTINVKRNIYSVPSRLTQEKVTVRVYDDRLEIYHGTSYQLTIERLRGEGKHRINYRHIIWSLVRKPNAFKRYKYRDELFPSLTFRRTYDTLCETLSERRADIEYLRLLHLAASTMQEDVEKALETFLSRNQQPLADSIKALVSPRDPEIPDMPAPKIKLDEYDGLLEHGEEMAR